MEKILKLFHIRGLYNAFAVFCVNRILKGTSLWSFKIKRKLLNGTYNIKVGKGTKIVGPIYCQGFLTIGENCWIGKNLFINGNGFVSIGDNCDIAPEVVFQTGGHAIGSKERRAGNGEIFKQTVGDGTWICGRATILNNTNIGAGCVVAGCACVVKDIPENSVAAGVPAKVIRRLDEGNK